MGIQANKLGDRKTLLQRFTGDDQDCYNPLTMDEKSLKQTFALPLETDPSLIVRGRMEIPLKPCDAIYPIILIIPGLFSFMDWDFYSLLAKEFLNRGTAVISFNHSTGGVSKDGRPYSDLDNLRRMTVENDLEDLRRIYKGLKSKEIKGAEKIDSSHVGIVGHSKGGGIGILYAKEEFTVRAVITINGVADLLRIPKEKADEIIARGYQEKILPGTKINLRINKDYWEQILKNPQRYDVLSALRSSKIRYLFLQGDIDDQVRMSEAESLHRAVPGNSQLIILEGVDHNIGFSFNSKYSGKQANRIFKIAGEWMESELKDSKENQTSKCKLQ